MKPWSVGCRGAHPGTPPPPAPWSGEMCPVKVSPDEMALHKKKATHQVT